MYLLFLILNIILIIIKSSFSLDLSDNLLTGKIISSDYISDNTLNAFDNDTQTSFKSFYEKCCWIGMDLLSEHYITKIGWAQNDKDKSNYILGIFEGSNDANFYQAIPLYMIKEEGKINEINYVDILTTKPFRYIRYVGPVNKSCIISEFKIYGYNNNTDIIGFINNEENYFYQPTSIPLLVMHSQSPRILYDTTFNMDCYIYIINNNKIEASGKANRKFRGNGSLFFPKQSYKLKFLEEKKNFLNFPSKSKNWNLISNYGDKTLIRNLLSLEISKLFEMEYTINCKPIDVICNGEYLGNYIICEKVEVKKDRINITKMNDTSVNYPEITGGYLLEIDFYAEREISKFISTKNNYVTIKYPNEKKILPEQHMYIENNFNEMERKLFKGDLSKIDINSFAKYFLVEEFTGNSDACRSIKMYKERNDEHFYFGPVWDFDLGFDNDKYIYPTNEKNKFLFEYGHSIGISSKFFEKILIDENVIKYIMYLWKYVLDNKLKDDYMNKYIDELIKNINESQRLNFIRWNILDKIIGNNPVIRYSFENELIFLKEFVKNRTIWMNKNILGDELYDKYKSNNEILLKIRCVYILFFIFIF